MKRPRIIAIILVLVLSPLTLDAVDYLGCYIIDKENRVYGVSPGNYNPNNLDVETCRGACGDLEFPYASVEAGSFCFCSDTNYAADEQKVDADCNIACSGDAGSTCGSHTHSQAYTTPSPIQVTLDATANVFTCFSPLSATIGTSTGTDLVYSFNYGDDSGNTPFDVSQSSLHTYIVPGEYIVTVTADSDYLTQASDAIRVYATMPVNRVTVECPETARIGEEVRCITTVIEGSDMTLSMDLITATVPEFNLADPLFFSFGRAIPQKDTTGQDGYTLLNGNPAVWIIPEAEITEYGNLIAWELYASVAGSIDLVVFRPTCVNVAGTSYCAKTNLCTSTCAGVWNADANPLYQDICDTTEVFCLSRKRCVPRDNPDTCSADPQRHIQSGDASSNPMSDYEVAWVYTTNIPNIGYNLIKVDDIADDLLFQVDVGDKIGFRATVGGAQVAFHDVAAGEPVSFMYDNINAIPTTGSMFLTGSGVASHTRHLLRALTSDPSLALVKHSYNTYGEYIVSSTVKNNLNSPSGHTESTIIYVEEEITGLRVEYDIDVIPVSDSITLKAWVDTGNPVNYTWNWGDGNEEIIPRQATNYADYDEKIHFYYTGGDLVITVNASNHLGSISETIYVSVQAPVLRNYIFTTNSPIHPNECVYSITYDNPNNDPEPSSAQFVVVFGDYENSTVESLGPMVNGDTNSDVSHAFRFPDEYKGKVIIFNQVNSEEFEVWGGSYEVITSLSISTSYIPEVATDETYQPGFGAPSFNIFPVDSPVFFEGTHVTGTTVTYVYDFGDGTVNTTTDKKCSHKYNAIGTYNIQLDASNPVGTAGPAFTSVEIQANIKDITIIDGGITSQNEAKSFVVEIAYIGTESCIAIDYGDLAWEFYGVVATCTDHPNYGTGTYISSLPSSISLSHVYTTYGVFRIAVHGFNLVSYYDAHLDFTVSDVQCKSPKVSIRDGSPDPNGPRRVHPWENILIQAMPEFDCRVTRDNTKEWSYVKVDITTDPITELGSVVNLVDLPDTDPKYLADAGTAEIRLPPYYLDIGIYKFRFYIQMDSTQTNGDVFSSYIDEYISIYPSELLVRVLAADTTRIEAGSGQNIVLDPGTYSKDPDVDPNADQGFTEVLYYCRQVYEPWPLNDDRELDEINTVSGFPVTSTPPPIDEGGCFNGGPGRLDYSDWSLTVNTEFMTVNVTHEFMVIVKKGSRKNSATLFVSVKDTDRPLMGITCATGSKCTQVQGGQKINPSSRLRLTGFCSSHVNVEYEWDLQVFNDILQDYEIIPDWKDYATGIETSSLNIASDFFTVHSDWTRFSVTLTGITSSGISGHSYMTVYVNLPPSGGTCMVVGSTSGVVGDSFIVDCANWVDDDRIASYQFFSMFANDTVHKQISFGMDSNPVLYPPLGPINNGYFQELRVKIFDENSAYTEVVVGEIRVTPPGDREADDIMEHLMNKTFGMLQQYADLAARGNTRLINSQVLLDASQLNGISIVAKDDYESTYGEYGTTTASSTAQASEAYQNNEVNKNKRAYIRSALLETTSQSSLDSMQDLQLVSSTTTFITDRTDELSHNALRTATNIVVKMANVFDELSSDSDHESMEIAAGGIIGTIGNIFQGVYNSMHSPLYVMDSFEEGVMIGTESFQSTLQDVDSYTQGSTTEDSVKQNKARDTVIEVEHTMTLMTTSLLRNKLPGETATTIETPTMSLQLQRNVPNDLANKTFSIGKGAFKVPPWCAINNSPGQDCNSDQTVDLELYTMPNNPYVFGGDNSDRVSEHSGVMVLNYRNISGDEIPLLNTAEHIEITVPRPTTTLTEPQYHFPEPEEGSSMVFHQFNVSDIDSEVSISISIVPDDLTTRYAVYLRYNERPTAELYDRKFFIPTDLRSNGVRTEFDENVYQYFIDNEYVGSNVGQYYLGLSELDPESRSYTAFISGGNVGIPFTGFSGNYSLLVSFSGCLYLTDEHLWSSLGCRVDSTTNLKETVCLCNHLTSFSSAWVIPPNDIDFDYVFANMDFYKNPTIYVVIICVFILYFIGLIWARRKDRSDLLLIGVAPLLDNEPNDKYLYEVVVFTGRRKGGGTDSKVGFILSGDNDETDVRMLSDEQRKILRRGAVDSFLMAVPGPLGTLNYMRIWHDNSGKGEMQSWYLNYIAIRDVQTGERFYFIANQWFSVVEDDGQIDRTIAVAGKEQMQSFDHVFSSTTRKNLDDGHIWFSIFARPPRSRFTRCQRISCCAMALWLEMLVNIMWYGIVPQTGESLDIGPFSLSPAQISIGVQANLIVFPISLLVIQIFRKARPKTKRKSRIEIAKDQLAQKRNDIDRSSMVSPSHIEVKPNNDKMCLLDDAEKIDTDRFMSIDAMVQSEDNRKRQNNEKKKKKKKKPFSFPHWCIYLAWFLIFLSIAVAVTFVLFYAVQMGDRETRQWFTSLCISFLTAIFLTQPIKVILIGIFVALILKTPNADEEDDAGDDEEEYELADDEEWLHNKPSNYKRERKLAYKPPDPAILEAARENRIKEIKMYSIIREIIFYVLFLWILLVISYGNRDSKAFPYMNNLITMFVKEDIKGNFLHVSTKHKFWSYAHDVLVPGLFADEWYNGDPALDQEHFLSDRVSHILGYPVIRQLRIKPGRCNVPAEVAQTVSECNEEYGFTDEEKRNFRVSWAEPDPNTTVPEYIYTSASELDGYPYLGRHAFYWGGGYIARLTGSKTDMHDLLYRLEAEKWIDKYTRAVFIEFSTYNAQANLFAMVVLLMEILPTGGGYPLYRIDCLNLLNYYTGFALFQVICEGTFFAFVLYFLFKELNAIRQQKKKYFKGFWNWIELTIVSFSIAAIVIYFYRFIVTNQIITKFNESGGTAYIKLQYVAYWNELLGYMLGVVVFLANLKFLKLLRFNKRMSLLSSTLRAASKDIISYFFMFAIVFLAFAEAFYLIFTRTVFDFADFVYTLETLFGTMLGKFKWRSMVEASSVLGPVLFFFFVLTITFILINMFLTILNESFGDVMRDLAKQSNEFEMVDFMLNRFKLWTGVGMPKPKPQSPLVPNNKVNTKCKSLEETIESFPDKVDQLLESVTKMYFNPSDPSFDTYANTFNYQQILVKDSNIKQDNIKYKY